MLCSQKPSAVCISLQVIVIAEPGAFASMYCAWLQPELQALKPVLSGWHYCHYAAVCAYDAELCMILVYSCIISAAGVR